MSRENNDKISRDMYFGGLNKTEVAHLLVLGVT
jgi:hypothetical protein